MQVCRRRFQVLTTPITRASHPSHIPKFCAAPPRLTPLALGDACPPPPPDQNDLEPPMPPPYGHDANPRSYCSPLRMISAFLDAAKSSALVALMLIERCHGVFCRSGGALGHGTGPWDDVRGVDVDMNARRQAVDERMLRRETQSMYWEEPTETRLAGCEPIMKRQRARRIARQMMRRQRIEHDA